MAAMKLRVEIGGTVNGLPELVAFDEGLFEAEGVEVDVVRGGAEHTASALDTNITDETQTPSRGALADRGLESGTPSMYVA